jgi:predicted nucleic acid-binding OB-fold protein
MDKFEKAKKLLKKEGFLLSDDGKIFDEEEKKEIDFSSFTEISEILKILEPIIGYVSCNIFLNSKDDQKSSQKFLELLKNKNPILSLE